MPRPANGHDGRPRPSPLFATSDLLHSKGFASSLAHALQDNTVHSGRDVVFAHREGTSFYKSTRKVRRTAQRMGAVLMDANGGDCKVGHGYLVVGKDGASSEASAAVRTRLASEFGKGRDPSLDVPGVEVREYQSGNGGGGDVNVLFVDLDSIDASPDVAPYELLQTILSSMRNASTDDGRHFIVHVRSEALYRTLAAMGRECVSDADLEKRLRSMQDGENAEEDGTAPIRRLRNEKGAARCPLTTCPARYVDLRNDADNGGATRVEVCRFHNYDARGCLRSKKVMQHPEAKGCPMDHDHCHRCGGGGHRALECPDAGALGSHVSSVVFRRSPGGEVVAVPLEDNGAIRDPTRCHSSLPALLVLGGRLRGRTLATCEMLPLTSSTGTDGRKWTALPNLSEHRGSHAACSPPGSGRAFVLGGGTADGNSDTTEVLDLGTTDGGNSSSKWKWTTMGGRLSSPRHAFGAVSCVVRRPAGVEDGMASARLFAVGGWMYGSKSCESVERLAFDYPPIDLGRSERPLDARWLQDEAKWELCAPLLLPRRLHSVAACADGSSIYVFGGYVDERRTTPSIERYDIAMDQWSACEELPFGQRNCPLVQALADQGGFLIFPFSASNGEDDVEAPLVQRYTPGSDEPFSPVIVPDNGQSLRLPIANWHSFSATASPSLNKAYLVGGTINGKWTDRSYELDLLAMNWEELPPMTFARRRLATLVME